VPRLRLRPHPEEGPFGWPDYVMLSLMIAVILANLYALSHYR